MADRDTDKYGTYIEHLKEIYKNCTKCEAMVPYRNNIVWGVGPIDAMIMIIAEAPGGEEDEGGIPFVGPAGKTLDSMLREVGIPREAVYITNSAMCRPTRASTRGGLANRPPTLKEVSNCHDRLISEILYVDPLIIMTLGEHATKALTGKSKALGKVRGVVEDVVIRTARDIDVRYPVLPTYHPSFLLQYAKQNEIYLAIEDMKRLKSIVITYNEARGEPHGGDTNQSEKGSTEV
jgi:DNA polymerase